MIFNNPVFKPIPQQEISEYSRPYVQQNKPQVPINNTFQQNNGADYEKLFTSETDFSSRLTDSQFQNFDNNQFANYLDFTSEIGSKIYRESNQIKKIFKILLGRPNIVEQSGFNDDSIIDQTWLGITSQNENIERITKGMEQINSLYNKIGEITENSYMQSPIKKNDINSIYIPQPQKLNSQNPLPKQNGTRKFSQQHYIPQSTNIQQQPNPAEKPLRNQSQNTNDKHLENMLIQKNNNQIQNITPMIKPQQFQRINSPQHENISRLRQQLETKTQTPPLLQIPQNTVKPQPEINAFVKPKYFRIPQWKSRSKNDNLQSSKLMVNCSNCGETVDSKDIEQHQNECIDALEIKMQGKLQFLSEMIIELNKKLQTVKQNILKIVQKRTFKNQQIILEILDYLIINDKDARVLRSLRERLQEQIIILKNTGDQMMLPLVLQMERANLLTEEKEQKIIMLCQDVLDDTTFLNEEFDEIEKQTNIEKNKLEQWKKQYETLLKVQMKDVATNKYQKNKDIDLMSNIRSDWEKLTYFDTGSQLQNGSSQMSDLHYQKNIEDLQVVQNNDYETKRMFFNVAVQCKLNLPMNHEGKNILIQDVYEKAMTLKLKQPQWQAFILKEMNSYQVQYQ